MEKVNQTACAWQAIVAKIPSCRNQRNGYEWRMRGAFLLMGGLLGILPFAAKATEATFSEDGKTLWVLSYYKDALLAFSEGQSQPVAIPLPEKLNGDNKPSDILMDDQGILMAGRTGILRWNPLKPEIPPVEIAPLPQGFTVSGMSRAKEKGMEGVILISGSHYFESTKPIPEGINHLAKLYALSVAAKEFKEIFVRRINRITACPAYDDGRMIFGGDYDLWEGGISPDAEQNERFGYLWGHRTAPLAMGNTDEANGEGQGVCAVEVAGGMSWSILTGHHAGASLVCVPLGKKLADGEEGHPNLADAWKIEREQLAQAKVIPVRESEEQESFDALEWIDGLCAWHSVDGNWKITYRAAHRALWVIEKDNSAPKFIGTERTGEK